MSPSLAVRSLSTAASTATSSSSSWQPSAKVPYKIVNRLTRLLKCRYPILLPGMSWISQAELVAAVCNAGGMGILATGPLSPDETRQQIRHIRQLTTAPFGVGVTLLMPGAQENAQVALQEQVPCVQTSLGKADWIAQELQTYGGTLICTVTNVKHGEAALQSGAHALQVVGHEAAAHGGDVTSLVLIPELRQAFDDIPLIGAGGFANGRGLAAAWSLGADGVAMGSRLAVTQESPLHVTTQEAIGRAGASDTIYGSNFDGLPARVLRTPQSQQLMTTRPWFIPTIAYRALSAARELNMPLWKVLGGLASPQHWNQLYVIAKFGAATQALTKATIDGDLKQGVQFIGQAAGLIHDRPHVQDLIQRIVQEAYEVTQQQAQQWATDQDEEEPDSRAAGM